MMRTMFFVLFLLALSAVSVSAQSNAWETLAKVEWYMKYSKTYDMEIEFPRFSAEVQSLNKKEMTIKGYVLPVDTEDGSIVISSLPWANCFFCGGGGVETVMAVYMPSVKRFKVDELVTFKGTLELNDGESGLIYNLKNAKLMD